jgi:hypothetical protein
LVVVQFVALVEAVAVKRLVVRRVEHQRCLVQLPGLHSDSSIFFFLKRHISLTQTRELEIVRVGDESTRVQRMLSGRTSVEPFHVFWSVSPHLQHDACNLSVLAPKLCRKDGHLFFACDRKC